MCVRSLDGGELHVTYCGPRLWGVVGDDPVELKWHRFPEHRFLDLRLPLQAPNLICWWRGRAPPRVLCYGVLWRPRGQVIAPLGQWAVFEVFPRLWLLEMAGAYQHMVNSRLGLYLVGHTSVPPCLGGAVV